jgi:hypothetical protein
MSVDDAAVLAARPLELKLGIKCVPFTTEACISQQVVASSAPEVLRLVFAEPVNREQLTDRNIGEFLERDYAAGDEQVCQVLVHVQSSLKQCGW